MAGAAPALTVSQSAVWSSTVKELKAPLVQCRTGLGGLRNPENGLGTQRSTASALGLTGRREAVGLCPDSRKDVVLYERLVGGNTGTVPPACPSQVPHWAVTVGPNPGLQGPPRASSGTWWGAAVGEAASATGLLGRPAQGPGLLQQPPRAAESLPSETGLLDPPEAGWACQRGGGADVGPDKGSLSKAGRGGAGGQVRGLPQHPGQHCRAQWVPDCACWNQTCLCGPWALRRAVLPGQRHPLPCPGPSCIPRSPCPAHGHSHVLTQKSPSHTTRHPRQTRSPQLPGHFRRQAPVLLKPARAHSSSPGSHMELLDLTPCPGTVGLALCTRSAWSSVAPAESQRLQGPERVQAVCGLSGERGSAQIARRGSLSMLLCSQSWPGPRRPSSWGVDPRRGGGGAGQGDMGGALAPWPGQGALAALQGRVARALGGRCARGQGGGLGRAALGDLAL